jgi:hypothetical protein
MFEILYTSTALVHLDATEMEAFLGPSRRRNAAADITGFLLHVYEPPIDPGYFVQVLEGPPDTVEDTYERIARDMLHSDVTTVHRRHTEGRAFRDWAMRLDSITPSQARAAVRLTGRTVDPAADFVDLLKQPDFVRGLVATFRTVTATS